MPVTDMFVWITAIVSITYVISELIVYLMHRGEK